jgi:CrcB protein
LLDILAVDAQRKPMMTTLFQVALGGAIGASGRYLTGLAAIRLIGPGFPWGTLIVNILGSFVMGVVVVVLAHQSANRFAPLLMTGVLGGFTTFSAFSLDAMTIWERGQPVLAGVYVLASVMLSLLAIFAGLYLARSMVQ